MIRNVIFDFDGTVVDSADDIIECLRQAYSSTPKYKNITIGRGIIGPPLREMIKLITPGIKKELIEVIIREYHKCYDRCYFSRTMLFPGTYKLLNGLHVRGIRLFLVTNKPIYPTRKILRKLSVNHFADIVTPDIVRAKNMNKREMVAYLMKKWKLGKRETLLIGDSASDVHAAHKNGIMVAGVLYGYGNKNEIMRSQPDYICDNIWEIIEIVRRGENE